MTFKLIICQEPIKSRCRQNIVSGNLGYETPVLDRENNGSLITLNWLGKQQLPTTTTNPEVDRLPEFSPSFSVMNAQVTRIFLTLLKYTLAEKILEITNRKMLYWAINPFGPTFDASIVYGPVFGQILHGF
jgi:hypothetical protein